MHVPKSKWVMNLIINQGSSQGMGRIGILEIVEIWTVINGQMMAVTRADAVENTMFKIILLL